jgi:hypothetical protein
MLFACWQDLRLLGQLSHGIYRDDCEGIHPDTIDQYYGTHGHELRRRQGQTGAGHPREDDDGDVTCYESAIARDIAHDEERNFHHAVEAPIHRKPFLDCDEETVFYNRLAHLIRERIIPPGYGILPCEWEDGVYPSIEVLRTGRRGKYIQVSLDDSIWRDRAVLWCQALAVLSLY